MDSPRKIGKYEVLERLGDAADGCVYGARDPLIERRVAIRVCTADDEETRRRFLDGAEIAGNLHHGNIATVFEAGRDDETGPFLVQEYLEGRDLATVAADSGPGDRSTLLGYLWQLARGLEYAHRKQVIHGALRPRAVRVLEGERVKILGFGTSRASAARPSEGGDGTDPATPYRAPEQLRGREADAGGDLFSFGVLAHELLTGEHPFGGPAEPEQLLERVDAGPGRALADAVPELPEELATLLDRCVAANPEGRPEGFAEITAALDRALGRERPLPFAAPTRAGGVATVRPSDLEATQLVEPVPPPPPPAPAAGAPPGAAATEPPAPAPAPALTAPARAAPPSERIPPEPQGEEPGTGSTAVQTPAPAPTGDEAAEETAVTEQTAALPAAEERERTSPGTVAAVVSGVILLLALAGGAIWWIASSPEAAPAEAAPASGGPPGSAEGTVVVQAVPWGRLVRIVDHQGRSVPTPPESTTPLTLRLPPGEHTLVLSHPDAEETASCTVEVTAGEVGRCRVELLQIESTEYFRDSGWWR